MQHSSWLKRSIGKTVTQVFDKLSRNKRRKQEMRMIQRQRRKWLLLWKPSYGSIIPKSHTQGSKMLCDHTQEEDYHESTCQSKMNKETWFVMWMELRVARFA
jgi:hypothetical protein